MAGSSSEKTCCDEECAYFNGCCVGGIECEGCGRYFCADEIDEYGLCEKCAAKREEEDEEEGDEE